MRLSLSSLSVAVAALAAGCLESGSETAPGGKVAVAVAPLSLPGVSGACYDVQVVNGDGDYVWRAGDPATTAPDDADALCSMDYGAVGGGLTYVGSCDAGAPATTVRLYVDSLWDGATKLDDWVNPCPTPIGCTVTTECRENEDVAVTFDLTVMRRAQQGFFDIAVNFRDVFCSAKLDCTYDDAGLEPITLLFDPATGQRGQTAVLGLACTAGPGEETVLEVSDVVVTCGSATGSDPWAATAVSDMASYCVAPPGGSPIIYGGSLYYDYEYANGLTDFGSGARGAKWIPDPSTADPSDYTSATFLGVDAGGASGNFDSAGNSYDILFPDLLLGNDAAGDATMLVRLGNAANPATAVPGKGEATLMSTISEMKFSVYERSSAAPWHAVEELAPSSSAGLIEPHYVDEVTRTLGGFAFSAGDNGPRTLYLYPRDPAETDHIGYKAPVALDSGVPGESCVMGPPRHGLVAGFCGAGSSWRAVVLDLDALAHSTGSTLPFATITPPDDPIGRSPSINGPGSQSVKATPVVIDSAHVAFQFDFYSPEKSMTQHIVLATRVVIGGTTTWVATLPFATEMTYRSVLADSACDYGSCSDNGASGADGVFWGRTNTSPEGSGVACTTNEQCGPNLYCDGSACKPYNVPEVPFAAWVDGNAVRTAPLLSQSELPLAGWRRGADVLVLQAGPDYGTIALGVYPPGAGAPVYTAPVVLPGGGARALGLMATSDGYRVFLGGWSGTTVVPLVVSGSTWSIGATFGVAGELDTADPTFDVSLATDVLNPYPCAQPVFMTSTGGEYNPSPTSPWVNMSRYDVRSLELVDPTTGATTPLPHPDTSAGLAPTDDPSPVPTYPLARTIGARLDPAGMCYRTTGPSGGPQILGYHWDWDVDLARTGVTPHLLAWGTGSWPSGGAYTHFTPSGLPSLPSPEVYGTEIARMAGSYVSGATTVYTAVGVAVVLDPASGSTSPKGMRKKAQLAVFEDSGSGWSVAQLVDLPSLPGLDSAGFAVEDLDPTTRGVVGSVGYAGQWVRVLFPVDTASAALRYLAPKIVTPPAGTSSCSVNGAGDGGLWAVQCDQQVGVITATDLAGSGSTVTPTLLSPVFESGLSSKGCTPHGVLRANNESRVVFSCGVSDGTARLFLARQQLGAWVLQVLDSASTIERVQVGNGELSFQSGTSTKLMAVTGTGTATWVLDPASIVLNAWRTLEVVSQVPYVTANKGYALVATTVAGAPTVELVQLQLSTSTTPPTTSITVLASAAEPGSLPYLDGIQGFRQTATGYLAWTGTNDGQTAIGHFMRMTKPTTQGGSWSLEIAALPRTGLDPADGSGFYAAVMARDAAWSLVTAEQQTNPRGCDGLVGTRSYWSDVTQRSYNDPIWIDLGASAPTATFLPGDPQAPTGQTTYAFAPATTMGPMATSMPVVLDPSQGPGNVWTTQSGGDPNPTDAVWQYASYLGNETLVCDGQPCNKRYWNVAIGFDPSASNCSVEYAATAGVASDFASGIPSASGAWPVIHYQAQLTGPGGAGNLVCRQNPLDASGSGVTTSYLGALGPGGPGFSFQFCHAFDGTLPATSVPGCATSFPSGGAVP